jgi:hypothetical protein
MRLSIQIIWLKKACGALRFFIPITLASGFHREPTARERAGESRSSRGFAKTVRLHSGGGGKAEHALH